MPVLSKTIELLERGVAEGQQAGVQLYVSVGEDVVADAAFGECRPGVSMTTDSVVPWMSSGKPLTAAAILRLADEGELDVEAPVAEYLPEFAGGGKHVLTIRHLLTHSHGLHGVRHDGPLHDWDEVLGTIASAELPGDWQPGERGAYDPTNGWFALGEVVSRLVGEPFHRAVRTLVLDPFELEDVYCGIEPAEVPAVADRLGVLYERSRDGLKPRDWMLDEAALAAASPGGNFRGPVRQLGRFYEHLARARRGHGATVLGGSVVQRKTSRHREGLHDETFQQTIDFGLGVIVNSKRYGQPVVAYGYGPHASDHAFGHGGVQSSIGFHDPDHHLTVAWITNGQVGEPRHRQRNWAVNTAIYEDLGLV